MPRLLAQAVSEATIDWGQRIVWVDTPTTPETFRGIEDAIADAEHLLTPATVTERLASLGELVTVFPMPDVGPAAREIRWNVYHKALGDMPADVLRDACEKLMRTTTFYPKPAEIREAGREAWGRRITLLTRLRALRTMKVQVRANAFVEPTEEEKARVRALVTTAFRDID